MNTVIISDQFYNCKHRSSFQEGYDGTAEICRWANVPDIDVDQIDVLVVDLALGEKYVDSLTETFNQFRERARLTGNNPEVTDIREQFEFLEHHVTRFLESGSVIIGLLATEKETKSVSSHDWIYRIHAAKQIEHEKQREEFKTLPSSEAIDQYFHHVQAYTTGIRLNEQTITNPELLAAHRLDKELVGVSFNEYRDRDGNHHQASGRIVLLPQPANIPDNLTSIVTSLENIGEYYWKRIDKEELLDRRNRVDLDKVIQKGEAETVEFKRQIPPNGKKIAKEVVGLANRGGGVLVIGVDNEKKIRGIEDIESAEERVSDMLSSVIEPTLNIDINTRRREDADLLVVNVPATGGPPRRVDGDYYLRIGTTCQKLDYPDLLL